MEKSICFIFLLFSLTVYSQDDKCKDRLREHVKYLSSDKLQGRKAGSQGEKTAAGYVYDKLFDAGVEMLTPRGGQDFSIAVGNDTIRSQNIVGIVEGCDPKLRGEYIVIGANIDHIGTNVISMDGKEVSQIYPGADDNASGIACLIEIAERVAASSFSFKRSVIFAGFGAKEFGMAGSWYFVNRAFAQIDSVSLMLNLNMVGRTSQGGKILYSTCVPNPDITYTIGSLSRALSFPLPTEHRGELLSSDYLAFYERNIPVTLFTTGFHRDRRTVRDTPDLIDYDSMEGVCEFVFAFAREVANRENKISVPSIGLENSGLERIYSPYEVDTPPQFYHGNEKVFLERWVYDYLRYPELPLAMGIQGQVIVEFIIEKDGSISNVKVTKGIEDSLDNEALRVISASPKWKAGVLGGQKVRVKFSIPVEFRLKKR